jgi:hypothetical protein
LMVAANLGCLLGHRRLQLFHGRLDVTHDRIREKGTR